MYMSSNKMNAYTLAYEVPSSQDYCNLREATGLSSKAVAAAAAGLPNSLFCVQIKYMEPTHLNLSSRSSTPSSDDSSLSLPDDASSTTSDDSISDDESSDGSSDGEPVCVGMARVIGDGALFFTVVDVAVHPAHQGHGLGIRLMKEIDAWLVEHVPKSGQVGLAADAKAQSLYAKFGFWETAPYGAVAMARAF